jgi:hypothetical protein
MVGAADPGSIFAAFYDIGSGLLSDDYVRFPWGEGYAERITMAISGFGATASTIPIFALWDTDRTSVASYSPQGI